MPDTIPDTTPDVSLIVATLVGLRLHIPPDGVADKVSVPAEHNVVVPVMAFGIAFTVTTMVSAPPKPRS